MERYLTIALVGVALLVLALSLSFIAMEGVEVPKKVSFNFLLNRGDEASIDVWRYTGAFSKNVSLSIETNCSSLRVYVFEEINGNKTAKVLTVTGKAMIKGLDKLVSPEIVIRSRGTCLVKAVLTFRYMEMKYAWLSIPAFLSMFIGGALLLIGGSAYLASKIRRAKFSR